MSNAIIKPCVTRHSSRAVGLRRLVVLMPLLALTALVTGCARINYLGFVGSELGVANNRSADPEVQAYLENLPLAQLALRTPGRAPSIFVLATRIDETEVWVDAAGARVFRRHGRIVGSEGIPYLAGVVREASGRPFEIVLADLLAGTPPEAVAPSVRYVEVGGRLSEQRSDYRLSGRVPVSVGKVTVETLEVSERVTDERGQTWTNRYWLLPDSLYTLRSLMKWDRHAEPILLDVLKLPAAPAEP
jgi:hypothetical protein